MRRPLSRAIVATAAVALLPALVPAQAPSDGARLASLRERIIARVARAPGAFAGVLYAPVGGPPRVELDADAMFHAASTMKVPVMIEVFRRVDAGALSLDQPVLLVNQFGSIVDGSPYALDAGDDSDSLMYTKIGRRVSVRDLVEHMITRSSNLATNEVITLVGAPEVTATARALGARTIRVLRGVEDGKAYERGLNNMTSARDLAALLAAIQQGRAASPASSDSMLAILKRQQFNEAIPAGLPPGTPVAHKTGSITAHMHDAAIVYPPGRDPYILVVLTRGIPDEKVARTLIADISRMVWDDATAR
jgi:beta-lactamase class A